VTRVFYFTPSYYCSSDCLMCGVAKQKRDERWGYTFEEACREIEKMNLRPNDILEISGGEPTAYKPLGDICKFAIQSFGARVLVLSHGRHLKSKRLATHLVNSGITRFVIPLFSTEPATHDFLTQVAGSWDETVLGLKNLDQLGMAVTVKFIPMKPNYHHMVDVYRFCRDNFPRNKLVISGYQMMGEAFSNDALVSPRHSEVAPHIETTLALAAESATDVNVAFVPLCGLDPIFWKQYRFGFSQEEVYTPDRSNVLDANQRNYVDLPAPCARCAVQTRCQWAWFAYVQRFGTDELKPIEGGGGAQAPRRGRVLRVVSP
jgi:hypothetical protein